MKNILISLNMIVLVASSLIAQIEDAELDALAKSEARRYEHFVQYLNKAALAKPSLDAKYYKLNIRIADQKGYVRGDVTTIGVVLEQTNSGISFDLVNSLVVDSAFVDGVKTSVSSTATTITLNTRIYNPGEIVSTVVYYHGTPPYTGLGSYTDGTYTDGTRWIYTLSEPYGARDWWPCSDHPSDKADSADIWITCKNDLIGVSNGKLIETVTNNDTTKTFKWKHRYPVSTYLIAVTIGKFSSFSDWFKYTATDSMEVVNYVLSNIASTSPSYRTNAALTPRMIEVFSSIFGPYPYLKEKYGHVQFGWSGGMEHQTLTSLGSSAFSEATIAHELVHQWFGDLITCKTWPDLWINEGFAQYFECVWREKQYGMASYFSRMATRLSSAKTASGTVYVQDTANVNNLFASSRVYNKGAAVLHMLRHVLGDSVFFAAIKAYGTDPKLMYANAATADFRTVCEKVSGRDLGWFFNEWIFGEKYPKYTYSYTISPNIAGYTSTVRVQQTTGTTNPAFFTMPIDLKLKMTSGDTTVTVYNSSADQTFQISTPQKPDTIQFDPDIWILRDVTKIASGVSDHVILPAFELYQNYPNPFNPSTTFRFSLTTKSKVRIQVYTALGQIAEEIQCGELDAGDQMKSWHTLLASGLYFYRLEATPVNSFEQSSAATRKMLILR